MKNQTSLSSLAILIIIMSACSASKKFDFADAYKFSHYHHQATEQEKPELVEDQVLTVSASENVAIKEKAIETTIENEKIRPIKTWTKEEKKELKKEIKAIKSCPLTSDSTARPRKTPMPVTEETPSA